MQPLLLVYTLFLSMHADNHSFKCWVGTYIHLLQDTDGNIEKTVATIKQAAPWLALFGKPGTENAQFFIVAESVIRSESKTLLEAFLDLIATYYVYDIAYPKALAALFIFFQHFVFGLKTTSLYLLPQRSCIPIYNGVLDRAVVDLNTTLP